MRAFKLENQFYLNEEYHKHYDLNFTT